jgi:membrane-associated protease RseP (regulator of RpoE activity)
LLLVLTVVGIVGAVLSFMHLRSYPLHDDGVIWVDRGVGVEDRVTAAYLTPGGPGALAGIHVGDQLVRIQNVPIQNALDVPHALWNIPLFEGVPYTLRRDGIEFQKDHIYIQGAPRDNAVFYQYLVGAFYLGIGLFPLFRLLEYLRRNDVLGQCRHASARPRHLPPLLPHVSFQAYLS